ncbi:chorismate mutase [Patescibacteria group bacterium]|nr:chorismate mutase [Patescibacteria group bacterium]MBU1124223.1 chorismate mutase [Patescibacteria group bacterium]MBU1911502.1 chorismate mutase [Patescibacteria group bacterium]
MTTITDSRLQLEQIDQQIIGLIADRIQFCSEAREREEGLDSRDVESEFISQWIEEAADHGIDEVYMEKVAGVIVRMCRAEEE